MVVKVVGRGCEGLNEVNKFSLKSKVCKELGNGCEGLKKLKLFFLKIKVFKEGKYSNHITSTILQELKSKETIKLQLSTENVIK